jgi:hypothetical protein
MNVVLHELSRRDDGAIQLLVSCGADPPRVFLATYDCADPTCKYCQLDEGLFMLLSELAHERFGNCVVYQMELMDIISAFARDEDLPRLPAALGTTSFCTLKPGTMRILWNKLWILLYKMGLYHPEVWTHPDYRIPAESGTATDRPRE